MSRLIQAVLCWGAVVELNEEYRSKWEESSEFPPIDDIWSIVPVFTYDYLAFYLVRSASLTISDHAEGDRVKLPTITTTRSEWDAMFRKVALGEPCEPGWILTTSGS